jgi:hypothetical protein
MSDPHRAKFITKSGLHDWQKTEVRKAKDKTTKCDELNFWHTLSDAKNAAVKSSRYLGVQGIFVEPELRKKLDRINQLIWNSLIEAESNKQFGMHERDGVDSGNSMPNGGVVSRSPGLPLITRKFARQSHAAFSEPRNAASYGL